MSEDLVWFALNQLEKEKLLNEEKEIVNKFEGLSRREVIKKIGLTSMIALPIVASLVAPSAIHAAVVMEFLVIAQVRELLMVLALVRLVPQVVPVGEQTLPE